VVPMGVSDQDCEIESLLAYLLHQRLPEPPNSRSGIKDNDLIADSNFDACGKISYSRIVNFPLRTRSALFKARRNGTGPVASVTRP
jgi:hypothetical protein